MAEKQNKSVNDEKVATGAPFFDKTRRKDLNG